MRKVHILNIFLFTLTNMLCSCFLSSPSIIAELDRKYARKGNYFQDSYYCINYLSYMPYEKYKKENNLYSIKEDDVVKLQNMLLEKYDTLKTVSEHCTLLKDSLNSLKRKANEYGVPVYYNIPNTTLKPPYDFSSIINDAGYQKLGKSAKRNCLNKFHEKLFYEYDYYSLFLHNAKAHISKAKKVFESTECEINKKKQEEIERAERERIAAEEEALRKLQEEEALRQQQRKIAAEKEKRRKILIAKYGERNGNLISKGKIALGMSKSMVADAFGDKINYYYDKSVRNVNGKRIETWYRTSKYTGMLGGFLGAFAQMSLMECPRIIKFVNGKVTAISD